MHGGVNYSGTTGSNTITLTQAEYDALPVEEQMDPEKVYYITDGVPTSTTVIPNPVTPATEDLNTLQIEETIYQIAGNGGSQAIETTLAAYEELPDEDKEDPNKVFYIKDVESNATFVRSPMIYSTSEAEVGVWTDGKPLYQKTISFGALPNNTTKNVAHGISNIDRVIHAYGAGYINNESKTQLLIPLVYDDVNKVYNSRLQVDNTNVTITVSADRSNILDVYITVLYTKTTDVPGSGKYTESGVPSVHYDDTERVIGTWFGDTLYQKTLYDAGGRSNSFSINHGITNLKAVVGYSGCVTDVTFPLPLPRISYDGNNVGVQSASETQIGICNPSAFGTRLIDWYITLQYTKTTD